MNRVSEEETISRQVRKYQIIISIKLSYHNMKIDIIIATNGSIEKNGLTIVALLHSYRLKLTLQYVHK